MDAEYLTKNRHFWAILIALTALAVRVAGIWHGYPYIFNVDEPTIVRSTLGLMQSGKIEHFDWPHLNYYINYVFYFLFIKFRGLIQIIGLKDSLSKGLPFIWNDPFIFYLISRLINAILGALTAIPVYLTAKRMISKEAGILAGFAFALLPFHVGISHMALPDIAMVFFIAWFMYYANEFSTNGYKLNDIVFAAISIGFAAGCKYNALLLSPLIVLLPAVNEIRRPIFQSTIQFLQKFIRQFIVFGLVSLAAFIVSTPEFITEWDLFWSEEYGKGFLWQLKVNSEPLTLKEYSPFLLSRLWLITKDLGYTIPLFFVVSSVIAYKNKKMDVLMLVLVSISIVLFTSRYGRSGSHYFLTAYVPIVIAAVYFIRASAKNNRVIYGIFLLPLAVLSIINIYRYIIPMTTRVAIDKFNDAKLSGAKTYYKGSDLSEINSINNLGMSRFKDDYSALNEGDIILSEGMMPDNDKIIVIETIGNRYRRGPTIYVYRATQ